MGKQQHCIDKGAFSSVYRQCSVLPYCLIFLDEYGLPTLEDASQQGCAACLNLVSDQRANRHSCVLAVETKVAPLKIVLICPHMCVLFVTCTPLCAACQTTFVISSSLFWTMLSSWEYISSPLNYVDCASCGFVIAVVFDHRFWWSGPPFLVEDQSTWPPSFLLGTYNYTLNLNLLISPVWLQSCLPLLQAFPPVLVWWEYFIYF